MTATEKIQSQFLELVKSFGAAKIILVLIC